MSTIEHQLLFLLGLVLLLNLLALRGLWQDIFTELRYQGRLLIWKARRAKRNTKAQIGTRFRKLADKIDPLPF